MKVYIVSWIQDLNIHSRVYSNREYALLMVERCKNNLRTYNFVEETIDREILNKNSYVKEDFKGLFNDRAIQDWEDRCIRLSNTDSR